MANQLTLDVNLALQTQVGAAGVRPEDLAALKSKIEAAHQVVAAGRASKTLQFFELPNDGEAALAAVRLGEDLRGFENVLVMGIGGSSLGAKALCAALCHPFHNLRSKEDRGGAPRIFFPDNSDPATFSALLETIDVTSTCALAITKSGGTAETWAQLLIFRERVLRSGGPEALKRQVVAVTDPSKGALRKVAESEGWRTLPVPPKVGGRFSVFTAVGLLPAAAAGVDCRALLAGAAEMVERCQTSELGKNPAYMLATLLYWMDTEKGRRIHVLMPYLDALRETADWFVQLWAESLGKKDSVGPTPVRAVGATDQHSLLQLLMEGPQDKLTVFVAADSPRADLTIPHAYPDQPDVAYLGGHSFHQLLSAEQRATAAALAKGGRPSVTVRLPELNARHLGSLLMMLEIATAFGGALYGVDPYDQPGVEAGKRYTCGLLGRPGYESAKVELEERPKPLPAWIV